MKRATRIASVLLALAMVLALSSCGKSGGDSVAPTANPTANPTSTPAFESVAPEEYKPPAGGEATPAPEQPEATDTPQYGGVYSLTVNVSPNTLFTNYRSPGFGAIYMPAVETLGRVDNQTNKITPHLAKSFEFDTENNIVTMKLNEGILFHDGSELTAEVVKWNLEFAMSNKLGASFYNPSSIECPDKYTVVVKFDKFFIDADVRLGQVNMYSKQAFDEHGADWLDFNPVGTGPFVFKEYVVDNRITYIRNDNYWMEGKPYVDQVDVLIIFDSTAAMTAFANGELSSYTTQDRSANDTLKAMGYQDIGKPVWTSYYLNVLSVSNKDPDDPWSNVKVRQAVMLYGLDYAELGLLSLGDYAVPNPQLCIPGSLLYDEKITQAVQYDPEKAKQMLAEAGYPDGFETDINAVLNVVPLATAMQDSLKKLNITANVIELSSTDPRRTDGSLRGFVILGGATSWDIIPRPVGSMFHPRTPTHGAHIDYPDEYERLFDLATNAKSYEERVEYGKQLMWLAHVEECLYVNAVWQVPCVYIQDNLRDSNLDYRVARYETMWFDQD